MNKTKNRNFFSGFILTICGLIFWCCSEEKTVNDYPYVLVGQQSDSSGSTFTFFAPDTNWDAMAEHAKILMKDHYQPQSSVSYYCSYDNTPKVKPNHGLDPVTSKDPFKFLIAYYRINFETNKWVFIRHDLNETKCYK